MPERESTPPSLPRGEQYALWDAVNSGDTAVATRILEQLVDAPSTDVCQGRGHTPLHVAAALGLSELVGRLIEAGAIIDRSTIGGYGDTVGETPLHFVCESGHTESVRLLLEAGADPDAYSIIQRGEPDGTFREYVEHSSDPAVEEMRSLLA